MLPSSTLALLLLISLLPVSLGQKASGGPFQNPLARIPLDGAKIFQSHCAACHGADARGHGPAAAALKQSLHDLTLLSSRNGGKFPYQKVKEIIQRKQPTQAAHGSSEMPIWDQSSIRSKPTRTGEKSGSMPSPNTWNLSSRNSRAGPPGLRRTIMQTAPASSANCARRALQSGTQISACGFSLSAQFRA